MYQTILITLDTTATDRAIIDHIKIMAQTLHSRVVLLHVATGAPARFLGPDAADEEVRADQAYLDRIRAEMITAGLPCETVLAFGEPVKEIINWVKQNSPDLVAMSTHGHGLVADLVLGTTAIKVQHGVTVPVLMLRAKRPDGTAKPVPPP